MFWSRLKHKLLPRGVSTAKHHLAVFARNASESLPKGAIILDAGAGDSPYREYFDDVTYEAADVCVRPSHDYRQVTHICDLTAIPVEASRYDCVLCTQVLEHVPEPVRVLRELNRVLKPGGKLWISAPLSFEEHEIPHDYYRYTQFGWRYMMEQAGFDIERLEWVQGYSGAVAYELNLARRNLPNRGDDYGGGTFGHMAAAIVGIARPLLMGLAWMLARADAKRKYTGSGHCLDYQLVASKR